ncbi:MAG: hypothetical protein RSE12_17155 [Fuscovulum sp.]|nr:MAG: hypothetical protein RSE12_17155 [Fuscovulum sp.]
MTAVKVFLCRGDDGREYRVTEHHNPMQGRASLATGRRADAGHITTFEVEPGFSAHPSDAGFTITLHDKRKIAAAIVDSYDL